MKFAIRMGVPEMESLWKRLQQEFRSGMINKKDALL